MRAGSAPSASASHAPLPARPERPQRDGEAKGAGCPEVAILPVTQATRAIFSGLYIQRALLVFIATGSKQVLCPIGGELVGEAGDVIVFPPGSMVTMENRPVLGGSYRADAVSLADDLVSAVFAGRPAPAGAAGVRLLRAEPHRPDAVLRLLKETLADEDMPPPIRRHRLAEPLVWLREAGVQLSIAAEAQPLGRVRQLIESDIARPWRSAEVAAHLAMSEATFRRWLARSGLGFARILSHTRLERGLTLLQSTDEAVSRIALDCGFRTPSHFANGFRARFGITPRQIRSARDRANPDSL